MHEKNQLQLVSGDILDLQGELCSDLRLLIQFTGHTLYFPISQDLTAPQLLPRENKLLLPLFWEQRQLGVLVLHDVEIKKVRPLLGILPQIVSIILEKLARIVAQRTDQLTGLMVRNCLFERLEQESAFVRTPEMLKTELAAMPGYRLCLGLIRIRLCNGEEIGLRAGFSLVDSLLVKMAKTIKEHIESDVLAVRLEQYEFGLLLHATGREVLRSLANEMLQHLGHVTEINPLTEQTVYPVLVAGYAYYPYDLSSNEIRLEMQEQSRILVYRAGLACDVAQHGHSLGFAQIIKSGGRILEVLPLGRYRINLGRQLGIKLGQCFAIYGVSEQRILKGWLKVSQVKKKDSLAELMHQEKAGMLPEAGDVLEWMRDVSKEKVALADWPHEILSQQDFFVRMQEKSAEASCFSLVMLEIEPQSGQSVGECLPKALMLWADIVNKTEENVFCGLYGEAMLLFFHPEKLGAALLPRYIDLYTELKQQKMTSAVGIANFPYLTYSKSDIKDCALKALEYALLLPEPRCGIFNSIALNISADRRFSLGDLFGALEEYKLALMADENNDMAWNSMGVCMAAMGRKEDARHHFIKALEQTHEPDRIAQIYYNLGTIAQGEHEVEESMQYFQKCLETDPAYLYAWIRLGQLYEKNSSPEKAAECYTKALEIEDQGTYTSNLARRHLAKLAQQKSQGDQARSLLQEALLKNPSDDLAMLMLAQIYLEGGEDPAIAEMLAQKSITIHERPDAWRILAMALRAQDKEDAACRAEAKASGAAKR